MIITDGMALGNCSGGLSSYPNGIEVSGGKKGSDFNYGKNGILKKITYPTGGYSQFIFESNTARISTEPSANVQSYNPFTEMFLAKNNLEPGFPLSSSANSYVKTYKIGGLRIASVINYGADNLQLLKKNYFYTDSYGSSIPMSSGILMDQLFYYFANEIYYSGENRGTSLISSSSNKVYGNNSAQGNPVGYDLVTEVQVGSSGTELGKTISTFRNIPNSSLVSTELGTHLSFDAPPRIFEEGNGKLLRLAHYKNFSAIPVKEIVNIYDFSYSDISPAHKVYYSDLNLVIYVMGSSTSGASSEVYDWYIYNLRRSYSLLKKTQITESFSDGSSTLSVVNYTYDSKNQLRSTSTNTSKENSLKEEFYYPYDQISGLNNYPNMSSLVHKNQISSCLFKKIFRRSFCRT